MLVIIQNDPEVPAGTYAEHLEEMGIPFRLVAPFAGEAVPPLAEVSAAIVLGGAMGVHDVDEHPFLPGVKRFIAGLVAQETPFLGICLGGQLLSDVLGAWVTSGMNGEKGTLPVSLTAEGVKDPLFAGIAREFITFQWHNDTFAIPQGGVLLASSAACPNQAFRCGKSAYGLQFHPEVNENIVDLWARWTEETAPRVEEFLSAFNRAHGAYSDASRRLLDNFLRIAGLS